MRPVGFSISITNHDGKDKNETTEHKKHDVQKAPLKTLLDQKGVVDKQHKMLYKSKWLMSNPWQPQSKVLKNVLQIRVQIILDSKDKNDTRQYSLRTSRTSRKK